jgi:putative acetyltransferase
MMGEIIVNIRQESSSDFSDVYEIHQYAFGQRNEADLVVALHDSDAFISELSLVAIFKNQVVGHILFTKLKIVNDKGIEFESLSLAPMAVKSGCQLQGIGSQLIRYGINKARELGYRSIIVLGHKNYYPRFGFEPTTKWQIKPPFDVPSDIFMALELVPNALHGITGTVQYPKEFELV